MNKETIKQVIISTIQGEKHLGDNLKEQCLNYIDSLEQALNQIKDYCNENIQTCKDEQTTDEWECCIEELSGVLQIIDKVLRGR